MSPESTLPVTLRYGRAVCGDLAQAERREWWLANGRGAYAAGTLAQTLTRRYHGLLIAPVEPPLGRRLVFTKADATLLMDGQEWPLFSNRWGSGVIAPQGHVHIESFHLEGRLPVWRYAIGDVLLESRVWLEPGADTVYVAYRLLAGPADQARLQLTLLVNGRDHHGSGRWDFRPAIAGDERELRVVDSAFTLRLRSRGGVFSPRCDWYEDFDLPAERERGLPERDSHLCVGELLLDLHPGAWAGLVGSLHDNPSPYLEEALRRAQRHDHSVLRRARVQNGELLDAPPWIGQMVLATDSFLFARPLPELPDGESVIAGYPWFGDWGRDTMIALPGLTLASGRYDSARRILLTFARFVDQGMLPNVFPGAGATADYNTVDAALWYLEAWRAYVAATDDRAALREAWRVLESIVEWQVRGTRYGIQLDPNDGLLRAGVPGVQLTWMDAKLGDWVVTPRHGKPVEINALWYNGLKSLAALAQRIGHSPDRFETLAAQARSGFRRFVRPDGAGLYDVIDGPDGDDASVRPNQIFAVSLPHSPLDPAAQAAVVAVCGRELLTSYGLRSLSPHHPAYRPHYSGGVWERDSGYHQGPVWTWLLGHYALAHYRVHGDADRAQSWLTPLADHLHDAGLGTVSEIFDSTPPHRPGGAPAQAWSVACTLEAWLHLERARRQSLAHPDPASG